MEYWLRENKIDQKQSDAITLLETIEIINHINEAYPADQPRFEITSQWQSAIDEIDRSHFTPHPVINELRLKGDTYFTVLAQSPSQAVSMDSKLPPADPAHLTGLHGTPLQLSAYLSEQWCRTLPHPDSDAAKRARTEQRLLDALEQSGTLLALKDRADHKQSVLDEMEQQPGTDELGELERLQLCDWYFSSRLGTQIPDHPHRYATRLGFLDEDEFYAMLLAEYLYSESQAQPRGTSKK